MLLAVFSYHILFEFSKFTARDIDHLIIWFLLRGVIAFILVVSVFFNLSVRSLLGDGSIIGQTRRLRLLVLQLFYVVIVLFVEDLWVLPVLRLVLVHFQLGHLFL